jgi:hypothetical protein
MAEESWHEARLIPTSGINGAEEQERRATSALLAVLSAVKEFGRAFVRPFGAPAGTLDCFIEVPFKLGEKRLYPDGLIRVSRGAKSWTALVEVKTGPNQLATEQLENYLDVARENGFEAVITISNEIPAVAGQHPTKVDKPTTSTEKCWKHCAHGQQRHRNSGRSTWHKPSSTTLCLRPWHRPTTPRRTVQSRPARIDAWIHQSRTPRTCKATRPDEPSSPQGEWVVRGEKT